MKRYEYTYKIENIDLLNASVLVKYTTTDEKLTSYTLNIPGNIVDENGNTIYDVVEVVKLYAPHNRWEAQENLLLQFDNILNKTDLVIITNA